MTPEKRIQNSIINYLHSLKATGHPLYYERRQTGGFSYKAGLADLYAVYNGLHIEIEIKRPGGNVRVLQEKWEEVCKSINIIYMRVDNVEDVKRKFKEYFGV